MGLWLTQNKEKFGRAGTARHSHGAGSGAKQSLAGKWVPKRELGNQNRENAAPAQRGGVGFFFSREGEGLTRILVEMKPNNHSRT
jgi:hypothetical protein